MKKLILIPALLLSLGSAVVIASGHQGKMCKHLAAKLNLTAEQQVKFDEMKATKRGFKEAKQGQRQALRNELFALDAADPEYQTKLDAIISKQASVAAERTTNRLQARAAFLKTLSAEQKASLKEYRDNHKGKHGYKHGNKHRCHHDK